MSLDYPSYEELRRRKHPAALWWRIGDVLYYLGLLPAMCAVASMPIALVLALLGRGWRQLQICPVVFVVGVVVFLVGCRLKRRAYRLAGRDGIPAE